MNYTNADANQNIKRYLADVRRNKTISPEQEQQLGLLAMKGDRHAINQLVEANLRLVLSEMKPFLHCGLSEADLIEEGNIGLLEAAQRFNPQLGSFYSFARQYVIGAIKDALADAPLVHLPRSAREGKDNILTTQQPDGSFADQPTPAAIRIISLDQPFSDDDDTTFLETFQADYTPADQLLEQFDQQQTIRQRLHSLSPAMQEVLTLRLGLNGQHPMQVWEIAQQRGTVPTAVYTLLRNACKQLGLDQKLLKDTAA